MSLINIGGWVERLMAGDRTVCMACHVLDLCVLGDLLWIQDLCIIRNFVTKHVFGFGLVP